MDLPLEKLTDGNPSLSRDMRNTYTRFHSFLDQGQLLVVAPKNLASSLVKLTHIFVCHHIGKYKDFTCVRPEQSRIGWTVVGHRFHNSFVLAEVPLVKEIFDFSLN